MTEPVINFPSQAVSDLEKLSHEYGEKVAWRGFYPSAESVGEYFGLIIIFILISYFINMNFFNSKMIILIYT